MARIAALFLSARRTASAADETAEGEEVLPSKETFTALADVALGFGPTVAFDLEKRLVWVDVTGCGHLHAHGADPEGERTLARRLGQKARQFGFPVRVAVAEGPRIAGAFACHAPPPKRRRGASFDVFVVPKNRTREALGHLPLVALPVDEDTQRFLFHLGLSSLAAVQAMPRAALGVRLGANVTRVLSFLDGDDQTPLSPYVPPLLPEERADLEYGVQGQEALLFVVRGLCSRLGARLTGRALAASRLEVVFALDRALLPPGMASTGYVVELSLPAPLARGVDLFAVLRARLDRVALPAPALAVTVRASRLGVSVGRPMHLFEPEAKAERALPRLVAELSAEIGDQRVGLLSLLDRWALRERSALVPLGTPLPAPSARFLSGAPEPTRLTSEPLSMRPKEVQGLSLVLRVEDDEWWRKGPSRSDFFVGWLPAEGAFGLFRAAGDHDAMTDFFLEGWLD